MKCLYSCLLLGVFTLGAFEEPLQKVTSSYRRSYTVLEIGMSSPEFLDMLQSRRATSIALCINQDREELLKNCSRNITLLAPHKITCAELEILGRCEHFDVVIVHDISSVIATPYSRLVAVLLALGDHVFLEATSPEYESVIRRSRKIQQVVPRTPTKGPLFLAQQNKNKLTLARFTQDPSYTFSYQVRSTKNKKEFFKEGVAYPIGWVHGINLVSFVMLAGIYPTDKMILTRLHKLENIYPHHTDLVLGNLIVKGSTLIPIDKHDTRRRADAHACITCACKAFKRGNRLLDPRMWIDEYYKDIMKFCKK